jgi:hypothetical protein
MHPLINNLGELKINELELKIGELGKKYFMTQNFEVQGQILTVLNTYQEELTERRRIEWEQMSANRDRGLDKLININ